VAQQYKIVTWKRYYLG